MKITTSLSAALFLAGTALSLRAVTQGLLPAVVSMAIELGIGNLRNALQR